MICMIPKVNLGIGEMGFTRFSDKLNEFALFDFGFAKRHIQFSEF